MTARSGLMLSLAAGLTLTLGMASCDRPSGLELIPEAVVSCPTEQPTSDQQSEGTKMLPGRVCGACHRTGGQAANSPWTLSGTVFADVSSPCNTGGVANIGIDILYSQDDPNGGYRMNEVQPSGSLRTNDAGNFYTAAKFVAPMRIRIYDPNNPTRQALMSNLVGQDPSTGAVTRVDCNFCHYPGSPNLPGNTYGRIYLP